MPEAACCTMQPSGCLHPRLALLHLVPKSESHIAAGDGGTPAEGSLGNTTLSFLASQTCQKPGVDAKRPNPQDLVQELKISHLVWKEYPQSLKGHPWQAVLYSALFRRAQIYVSALLI